jgi:hypothetical protein
MTERNIRATLHSKDSLELAPLESKLRKVQTGPREWWGMCRVNAIGWGDGKEGRALTSWGA